MKATFRRYDDDMPFREGWFSGDPDDSNRMHICPEGLAQFVNIPDDVGEIDIHIYKQKRDGALKIVLPECEGEDLLVEDTSVKADCSIDWCLFDNFEAGSTLYAEVLY